MKMDNPTMVEILRRYLMEKQKVTGNRFVDPESFADGATFVTFILAPNWTLEERSNFYLTLKEDTSEIISILEQEP